MKCKLCIKEFDILALKKHYSEDHLANSFACDKCDKSFVREDFLKKHQTEKHDLVCLCGICKQGFQSLKELEEHFENHELQPNSFEKIHSKPLKKKSGTTKKTIMIKYTSKSISKENKCVTCDTSFRTANQLLYHIASTHEKTHKCDNCDKVFAESIYLQIHLGEAVNKAYHKCDSCTKLFKNSCGKMAHMKDCQKKPTILDKSREKLFGCRFCKERFDYVKQFLDHVKTHPRTFMCQFCMKFSSKDSDEVANHEKLCKFNIRENSAQKKCNICNNSFSSRGILRFHVQFIHNMVLLS